MKSWLLLAVLFTQPVFASALFDRTNANFWLFENNGAVSGYSYGDWLAQFNSDVYVLGQGEQVLINELPSSSIPMNSQLSPLSIDGLGKASNVVGQSGGDTLLVEPAPGNYTETLEILMLADVDLVDTYGSITLLWQVNGGTWSSRVFNSSSESIDGFFETSFFLVNNGTHNVHVELLDNTNVEIDTLNLVYNMTSNHADGERRDTDLDGLPDLVELAIGLDPLKNDWQIDSDGNGWSDFDEWLRSDSLGVDGLPVDSDGDGWSDFDENLRGTNPADTVQALKTIDSDYPAPTVDTQQYSDVLLSFKEHPVVDRLYEVEYWVIASKQSGQDTLSWNATASSYSLTGVKRFDSETLLSQADLTWADVGSDNIADSLKQSTFDSTLQLKQQAEFRVAASMTQVLDVVADETIIINADTPDEAEALRRWHYRTLLVASPDLIPARFRPAPTWTTAEDWKQLYIDYLQLNLVLKQDPLLSLDHNLFVEALQLLLAYEIELQGGSGSLSWDDMQSSHQQVIRRLQDSLSNREDGRNLYDVFTDLQSMLLANGLTETYSWLQNMQSSADEAVDVSFWLQNRALVSTDAQMNNFRYLGRYTLFVDGLTRFVAIPDLAKAGNDTDRDGLVNRDEVEKPFAISTYPWAVDTDGDQIIDSADSCPTDANPGCDTLPLLQISTILTIDEPQSGQTQNLLIGFQLDRIYDHDVSFSYTVTASASETATAGVDFTPLSGSLVISAGQQVVFITVPILPDSDYTEGDESFHIELFDIDNAVAVDSSAVITLIPAVLISDTDARLAGLQLSDGVLSPAFAASTFSYSTTVADKVTSITVTPTTWDINASVTVNGLLVASGSASNAINLNLGSNTISIVVTAQDGATTNDYSIIVTREATVSTDASLAALSVSGGLLTPAFDSATLNYDAAVVNVNVAITPTTSDASASVTVNGVAVTSGSASRLINLDEGQNAIEVVVTAEDGITAETYTVVVTRIAASFGQQAYIKASNAGTNDLFARVVALDGDTLVVGAKGERSEIASDETDNNSYNTGAVYVFIRDNDGTWTQQAYLKASNLGYADEFGISVALSGNTLAVGATEEDSDGSSEVDNSMENAGAVYIFTRDPNTGIWTQQAYIKPNNPDSSDRFGEELALSGDTLAVGVRRESSNGSSETDNSAGSSGAVFIFTRSNTSWTQQAFIKGSNTEAGDEFGSSVALEAGTLVVGAPGEDSDGSSETDNSWSGTGAVYVFTGSGSSWTQQAYLKAMSINIYHKSGGFGQEVDLSGDSLAVGAPSTSLGAAYVYTRSGSVWSPQYRFMESVNFTIRLGSSVALSTDSLAVGANNGNVYLYTRSGASWNQPRRIINASNAEVSDLFGATGSSISLSGDTLAIGASGEDSDGSSESDNSASNAGAAYVFLPNDNINTDADLSALALSDAALSPAFDPAAFAYKALVDYVVSSITVTPTTSSADATVKVNAVPVTSGQASAVIDLAVGDNVISVEVTAEDEITLNSYNIIVTREVISSDSSLAALTASNGTLLPVFDSAGIDYDVVVRYAISSVKITPTVSNAYASVTVDGVSVTSGDASDAVEINIGANTVLVVVTAENGSFRTYTLNINRESAASVYTVGGTVSGLAGTVILENNLADVVSITSDGLFMFVTEVENGGIFDVTVISQPTGQTCTVVNGSGAITNANVSDVTLTCVNNSYTVGGLVGGLVGSVTLQNNAVDDLIVVADGEFTFATAITHGEVFDVSVSRQPDTHSCSVTSGSGVIDGADVVDVNVICSINTYTVGGYALGLSDSITLQNNAADDLFMRDSGEFVFSLAITSGGSYNTSISIPPAGQDCLVSNGSGGVTNANITDILITCSNQADIFLESMLTAGDRSIVVGDVDGDGDLDLVHISSVWLNAGNGSFKSTNQDFGSGGPSALALGDIDGDGDLDLVRGSTSLIGNSVWFNDGNGIYIKSSQSLGQSTTFSLTLGDVDGDGDLDLVEGNDREPDIIWLNDGRGVFTDSDQRLGNVRTNVVLLADLDGNNTLDLVSGEGTSNNGKTNTIWWNDGDGNFTDSGQTLGDDGTTSLALGDVDGDGDLDLIEGNNGAPTTVRINDGSGIFSDSGQALSATAGNYTSSVTLGDIDGDGDLDLIEGYSFGTAQKTVWTNDGTGLFSDNGKPLDGLTWYVALADVDGDGDLDLLANDSDNRNGVWLNVGGDFIDTSQAIGSSQTFSMAVFDVDGDGDIDYVDGNTDFTGPNILWLNDGIGNYSDSGQVLSSGTTRFVVMADFNADGHIDLVEGLYAEPNRVWFSDGAGNFTDSGQALGSSSTYSLTTGDVDKDGDIDLVEGNYLHPNIVWINDGAGTFTDNGQSFGLDWTNTNSVVLGDVDGDGDLDLVEGNYDYYAANKLWLNDGSGNFSDSGEALGDNRQTIIVLLNDIDGDGDLDILETAGHGTIWINDGTGGFTDSGQSIGDGSTSALVPGDVDGDGDLDLLVGNASSSGDTVWINDGNTIFSSSGQHLGGEGSTRSAEMADVDGDGDLDVLVGNQGPNTVYINQTPIP